MFDLKLKKYFKEYLEHKRQQARSSGEKVVSPYLKYMKNVLVEVKRVIQHKATGGQSFIPKGKDWQSSKTVARQKRLYMDCKPPKFIYSSEGMSVRDSRSSFHPSSKVIFQKYQTKEVEGRVYKETDLLQQKARELEQEKLVPVPNLEKEKLVAVPNFRGQLIAAREGDCFPGVMKRGGMGMTRCRCWRRMRRASSPAAARRAVRLTRSRGGWVIHRSSGMGCMWMRSTERRRRQGRANL